MGQVIISNRTCKDPITCIGEMGGICYGSRTDDDMLNYERGKRLLASGHGRTYEFPDVYLTLDGYSARVVREWYTHIGGSPTRLQASTRYINYTGKGFDYIVPPRIQRNEGARIKYEQLMQYIKKELKTLSENYEIPNEDLANGLPLGMTTVVTCKINLRTLMDMSHQRLCSCAYWEYRQLFTDLINALNAYSEEWLEITDNYFMPKCEYLGYCNEGTRSCGRVLTKK